MGAQDQQVSLATNIINSAQQTINNYCSISCSQNISNVNITIIGGNATINITQTCTAIGTECAVKNLVGAEISNLISNLVDQSQSNAGILSLFGPASSQSTSISNNIKNQISQLVNNTCQQDINQNISALNIFALDANSTINIAQTGTMDHASCVLDTVAKLVLTNNVANDVKQKQTSCGNILTILIIVAAIIVLILLFPIIRSLFGGGNKGGGGGGNQNSGPGFFSRTGQGISTGLSKAGQGISTGLSKAGQGISTGANNFATGVKGFSKTISAGLGKGEYVPPNIQSNNT
jgi:hypothetical protein